VGLNSAQVPRCFLLVVRGVMNHLHEMYSNKLAQTGPEHLSTFCASSVHIFAMACPYHEQSSLINLYLVMYYTYI